jgi:hypothetical protein
MAETTNIGKFWKITYPPGGHAGYTTDPALADEIQRKFVRTDGVSENSMYMDRGMRGIRTSKIRTVGVRNLPKPAC